MTSRLVSAKTAPIPLGITRAAKCVKVALGTAQLAILTPILRKCNVRVAMVPLSLIQLTSYAVDSARLTRSITGP